ncbi:Cephalosporin-C deacetylase [Syntrophobotulus glycolicus DSM 8271]|uniref:Cephalosporin-C deacetylase n=1 Tax=Syntrophobotulus glycolicus (strain DSM 8271 / FlGlyR) TaxID=645991 RepID=F0SWU9_SYNGF|nr:alpha/beta fold hydrolase [Syntrophobotulus glycolicus]ADY54639.1 Cephalosporin-C deacetylase [Syntrophobotulus glycolicus DSM 8271]
MDITEEKTAGFRQYKPDLTRQPDFESFWYQAMEEVFPAIGSQSWRVNVESEKLDRFEVSYDLVLEKYPFPLKQVIIYQAQIEAADGTLLKGWYLLPSTASPENRVPGLVRFHGYSSNKGKISELLLWALQGYAVLAMDIRGQCGDTPDGRSYSAGAFSGWLTLGLDSPMEYYYRQVYLDSVQIIESLARRPEINEAKIGLFGNSQGGGIAIAAAALLEKSSQRNPQITGKIAAINAGIPFLADMKRAYLDHGDGPWAELSWYFRMHDPLHEKEKEIFQTLSYFDLINFAPWLHCPVLISVGLKDTACPPSTIYALYRHLAGEKTIIAYPDYGHEDIDNHTDKHIAFFAERLLNTK